MNVFTRVSTTFLLSLALTACGSDRTEPTGDSATADVHVHGADCEHDAEAPGPHGGALAAVGTSAARLEALHDEVLGQVTIYVLDAEGTMLTLDQPPVLNMVTDEGSAQLKPTQIGGAWVFESDDLLDEPQKARFRIALAGKSWTVNMPCSHEHDAEHGDEHEIHEHGTENEGDEHVEVDHDHATHDDHGHEDGDEDGKGHDADDHGHEKGDDDGHDDDEHGSHEGGHDDD